MNKPPDQPVLPGERSILVVCVIFGVVAVFFTFLMLPSVARLLLTETGSVWRVVGDAIRTGGAVALCVLSWRYAVSVRHYNQRREAAAERLGRAHAALWLGGAIVLAAQVAYMVATFILTRM